MAEQKPVYEAGGGLLSRRHFLTRAGAGSLLIPLSAKAGFNEPPPSWQVPGKAFSNYGTPSDSTTHPIRWISNHPAVPGEGVSWTPLHQLHGTITPNGLHFERHHNGIPEIDANTWELAVHGEVKRPLALSLNDLHRLPFHSRQLFIECGGNSNAMWREQPLQTAAGYLHGLMSCAEWTGVMLSDVLDIAGLSKEGQWIIADGLDSAGVTVSMPLSKAIDDVFIGLYQNGEPIRAAQGFPARLVVPGWEGIRQIKWLRSLMVARTALMSKFDTVSYTEVMPDGKFERFTFEMGVKSLITQPSPGHELKQHGLYEIRGIAWSGAGKIIRVEVSADSGASWAEAELQTPVLDRSPVRFRLPWHWQGQPAMLTSRAIDDSGNVQPDRNTLIAAKGTNAYYHYNGETVWSVDQEGAIRHAYR